VAARLFILVSVQLTFNKDSAAATTGTGERSSTLADLRCGEVAVLENLHVGDELGRRLMELGFFPGGDVTAAGCAPGGDPRVYRVDGSEIALRGETARLLTIRTDSIRQAEPSKSSSGGR